MKRISFFLLLGIGFSAVQAQDSLRFHLHFPFDKDQPYPGEWEKLQQFKEQHAGYRLVSVNAHTDQVGTQQYNIALSQRRLNTVNQHLEQAFSIQVPANTGYHGERQLLNSSNATTARYYNRRVELLWVAVPKVRNSTPDMKTLQERYKRNLDALKGMQAEQLQKVTIHNSRRRTVIDTKAGNRMVLDSCSFEYLDGRPYNGKVQIAFREYTDVQQFLMAGLLTVHQETFIQSGGMLDVKAFDSVNLELRLKKGKYLQAGFNPAGNVKYNDWLAFNGVQKEGLVSWELDTAGNTSLTTAGVMPELSRRKKRTLMSGTGGVRELPTSSTFCGCKVSPELSAFQAVVAASELNYINCDRFPNEPVKNLVVYLPDTTAPVVSLVFPSVNGVMSAYMIAPGTYEVYNVPVNVPFEVVAFSFDDEGPEAHYYFGNQSYESHPRQRISGIQLRKSDKEGFTSMMKKLARKG